MTEDMTREVRSTAREAGAHPLVRKGARLGFVVSGLLHLLVGWIALRVAWGAGGGDDADQSGALAMLANTPAGPALLWIAAAGLALLAAWFLVEAVAARRFDDVTERIASVAKAAVYSFLALSAVRVTRRVHESSEEATRSFTADLMAQPGGRLLVGAVGLAVLGVAGFYMHRGWTKGFAKDLESRPGRFVEESGRIGYIAKGAAFLVVAFLFVSAALNEDAGDAGGLDGALRALRDQPFGPYLLSIVALGIAAFGVYMFGRARHAKL